MIIKKKKKKIASDATVANKIILDPKLNEAFSGAFGNLPVSTFTKSYGSRPLSVHGDIKLAFPQADDLAQKRSDRFKRLSYIRRTIDEV